MVSPGATWPALGQHCQPAAPRAHLFPKSSPGPRGLAATPADDQATGAGLPSLLSLATKDHGQWAREVISSSGPPQGHLILGHDPPNLGLGAAPQGSGGGQVQVWTGTPGSGRSCARSHLATTGHQGQACVCCPSRVHRLPLQGPVFGFSSRKGPCFCYPRRPHCMLQGWACGWGLTDEGEAPDSMWSN